MEKHAYLNDLPPALVMTDDDTVVIGQKTEVDGKTRYIGKTVPAGELNKAMTALVLETANLPQHIEAMEAEVTKASEFAGNSGASAQQSEQSNQESQGHASTAREQAETAAQHANNADDLQSQCQQHEETAQDQAELSGRHAGDAKASEEKALESAELCEGFAAGLVSVLTMSINNYNHTISNGGGIA